MTDSLRLQSVVKPLEINNKPWEITEITSKLLERTSDPW